MRFLLLTGLLLMAGAHAAVDMDMLAGIKARSIGPAAMSGRVAAIAADPADPNVVYIGGATGGVFKSVNSGITWNPVFDKEAIHAIGAIELDPQNANTVWVGTGEGNVRNSASIGGGIYRSTDAGQTWQLMGLETSERIHRIVVHPQDSQTIWVAALGKLWSGGGERGVYKSSDGGKTWRAVLTGNQRTGASELIIDPHNPNRLYASLWEFARTPYSFKSGGPGSALYRSVDGGENWQKLGPGEGLPAGELGRIALALAPSEPNRIYALVEAQANVLMRSDNGGDSFIKVNESVNVHPRPFYFSDLIVDPERPERVYKLAVVGEVSNDGGKTFETFIGWDDLHPDHHALWVHPQRGDLLINGNDGGVGFSYDRGATWRYVTNLPLSQFYHVRVDNEQPYNIYGGLQDNGSWQGPSQVWEAGGIQNHHWREVNFGDGFDTMPDPDDASRGYAMSQEGYVVRYDTKAGSRRMIRPAADDESVPLRFHWNAAIAQDPFASGTIYFGSQFVHRSDDRGETWQTISPDLTRNDAQRQNQSKNGGLTPDITGAENHNTLIALAASELSKGVLWAGSDDGRLHITTNGGGEWREVALRGAPNDGYIAHIFPSSSVAGRAFVVLDNHRNGDMAAYAWRVDEFGARATKLALAGVTGYALALMEDPAEPKLLYLGTELGFFLSFDAGGTWQRFTHGLPSSVSVMDLAFQRREDDLVLGTHGRGFFVIDDVGGLRAMVRGLPTTTLALIDTTPGTLISMQQPAGPRFGGNSAYMGENESPGAVLTVVLNDATLPHPNADAERQRKATAPAPDPSKPAAKLGIEIRDGGGALMRFVEIDPKQGVNRWVWNLAMTPPRSPAPPGLFDPAGPSVLPGNYRVRLRYGDARAEGTLEVRSDPRSSVSLDALAARQKALVDIGKVQTSVVDLLDALNAAKAQWGLKNTQVEAEQAALLRGDPTLVLGDDHAVKVRLKTIAEATKAIDEAALTLWQNPQVVKGYTAPNAAMDRLGEAQWMLGAAMDAPTPAARRYAERAIAYAKEKLSAAQGVLDAQVAKVGP